MKPKITNFTDKGKCIGCGQCCSDILHLSEQEIEKIDNYIKNRNIKPNKYRGDLNTICPFRNETLKICMIYEVRPDICRVFKCDQSPTEIEKNKELFNSKKLPRSMRAVFFNDNRNIIALRKFGLKIYGRKE